MDMKNGKQETGSVIKELLIFSFAVDPATNRATMSGNIPIQQALNLLQQLAVAQAVAEARDAEAKDKSEKAVKSS